VTNASGGVIETHDFLPFGVETPAPSGNNPLFAGKERDSTGADFSGVRYFASKTGRFLTPDPVSGRPDSPQTWNRYGYALNNPLGFVDPDGRESRPTFSVSVVHDDPCVSEGGWYIFNTVCWQVDSWFLGNQETQDLSAAEFQGPARMWPGGSGDLTIGGGILVGAVTAQTDSASAVIAAASQADAITHASTGTAASEPDQLVSRGQKIKTFGQILAGWLIHKYAEDKPCGLPRAALHAASFALEVAGTYEAVAWTVGGAMVALTTAPTVIGFWGGVATAATGAFAAYTGATEAIRQLREVHRNVSGCSP
jgi:RHS repeat-associated protein